MSAPLCSAFDAIVVGGGPGGATAAILLARMGQRVAVIEKAVFPRRKVCGEFISATTWPVLHGLGIAELLEREAGPVVRRVGVFAGPSTVTASMTRGKPGNVDGGRAVRRDVLDTVLLDQAGAAGATIWQPWSLTGFAARPGSHACTVEHRESGRRHVLEAPLVIAAHGSWESGPLPTQQFRKDPLASDLLGFKAHFRGATLSPDLMPLIAFPGGYGGLVNTGEERVSLSCCIRRDQLERCRMRWPGRKAGDAVLAHICENSAGVAEALAQATREGAWLAAGPIRPGVRTFGHDGVFPVGNAAAEAHPVIAEGISIAIQSAALLCEVLAPCLGTALTPAAMASVRGQYARAWRANFLPRMRASALYARIFMHPVCTRLAVAVMQQFPSVLQFGAGWSGKLRSLRHVTRIAHWPPNSPAADKS